MALKHVIFLVILLCHTFLLEDRYGYLASEPSVLYVQIWGLSAVTALYGLLYLALSPQNKISDPDRDTKRLGIILVATLAVTLVFSLITGGLTQGEGTGLMEIRASVILVFMYFTFRRYLNKAQIEPFVEVFYQLSLLSAAVFLFIYLGRFDIMVSAVDQYGRSTAFEGGFLFIWSIFFCYALANTILRRKPLYNTLSCVLLGFTVFLSFRRSFALLLIGSAFIMFFVLPSSSLRQSLSRKAKLALCVALVGALVMWRQPELVSRINPADFFRKGSEAYAKSYSSNVGHMADLKVGLELVRKNPIFGLGFGIPIRGTNDETIASSLLHSQVLHFWVRMGFLGVCLIHCFYYIMLKRAYVVIKKSDNAFNKAFGLAVYAFFFSHYLLSVIAPPFYISQKMQFIFMLLMVITEILYQQVGERSSRLIVKIKLILRSKVLTS